MRPEKRSLAINEMKEVLKSELVTKDMKTVTVLSSTIQKMDEVFRTRIRKDGGNDERCKGWRDCVPD